MTAGAVGAESPATRVALGVEKTLCLRHSGALVWADRREEGGRKADEDSLTVGRRAIPVAHNQQFVSAPAKVTGQPVAMADDGLGCDGLVERERFAGSASLARAGCP